MSMHDDIRDAAYSYLAFDLPIIPLCSHNHRGCSDKHVEKCKTPGKVPLIAQWTKHLDTTEDDLEEWFTSNRYSNIGVVLGQTLNYNLVGIDIDGDMGEQTFQEVSREKEIPHTWEFTSGNGRRLLYQLPMGVQTKKNRVAWKEGHEELAFMATGQQTVLPPSMHASGRQYKWIEDHSPQDCDLAEAPDWIIELVKIEGSVILEGPEDLPPGVGGKALQLSTPVVAEESMINVGEGGRSNALTRLVGSLCAKRVLSKEVILQTALQQNKLYCNPPLGESEVVAMVESIYNSEMAKHQKFLDRQRKKEETHPAALAEKFETQLNNAGIYWKYNETKGRMYRTKNSEGPWVMISQEASTAEIHAFLMEIDGSLARTGLCAEVYQQMVVRSTKKYGAATELNLGDHPYHEYVAINNGVLDWAKGELLPWDMHFNHTTMIEADWRTDVETLEAYNLWRTALKTWLDSDETIMFLQEYIGYALLPSCKMRTAVFLHGEGANGKSLFLDAIHTLFASTAMVTQPAALSTRFGTACIIDKLLIMCSDIDATYLDKTGVLKQLIAGDRIRAEYKGGKEFDFVPVGKLLFSANKLPKSADKSHGWYSRIQVVNFPHTFKEDAEYYETFIRTMTSPEGKAVLLHWAVEGLRRLRSQGKWTISSQMQEAKLDYRKDNDNVLAFISEQLEENPMHEESYKTSLVLKAVYSTYVEWCEDQGVKAVGQPEFVQRIQSTYKVKPLRWKVRGGWKTQASIIDTRFKEAAMFDGLASYSIASGIL